MLHAGLACRRCIKAACLVSPDAIMLVLPVLLLRLACKLREPCSWAACLPGSALDSCWGCLALMLWSLFWALDALHAASWSCMELAARELLACKHPYVCSASPALPSGPCRLQSYSTASQARFTCSGTQHAAVPTSKHPTPTL